MDFMTPGMEPGANQDDCGLAGSVAGGDAPDAIYPGNWDGHAFLNDSTAGDFNPYDANGDVRSYWDGGICTGWLDKTWDSYDHYSIAVPQGHYMQVDFDLDIEDSGILETTYAGVWIYMCQIQHLPCGFGNLAYFVDDLAGTNIDEGSLNTGLFPVGVPHNASGTVGGVADTPGWAYMRVYQSSFSGVDNLTYELNITFHPLSELEGGNQNDANCGCDAGTGAGSAVIVNDHMNQSQADRLANDSVLGWHGWAHGDLDTTDVYLFTVPANHGTRPHMGVQRVDKRKRELRRIPLHVLVAARWHEHVDRLTDLCFQLQLQHQHDRLATGPTVGHRDLQLARSR